MRLVVLSQQPRLYSTSRLCEAARVRGHSVRVVDHTRCIAVLGHAGPAVHFGGEPLRDVHAIIPRIGASVTSHGAAIVRQFEAMGIPTSTSSLSLRRARDKLRAHQILVQAGIPIPRTAFAHRPSDLRALISLVGGTPMVIKLLEGTHGVGVVLADTDRAARSFIEAFFQLNAQFMVQEYVAEAAGTDVRALVVDNRVVASMERRAGSDEFRSNLHHGGTSHPTALDRDETAIAVAAAKALRLSVAGVDLLRAKRGPLVLEVNASPGLEGIERTTGVDVATKIVEIVEQQHAVFPVTSRAISLRSGWAPILPADEVD